MSVSLTRSLDHTFMADATFESTDPTGSVVTDVQINATADLETTNGKLTATTPPAVAITLSVANESVGYFIVASEGQASHSTLYIDPNLRTAHLVATFDLTDLNGQYYSATANITWRSTGAVQKDVSRTLTSNTPGVVTYTKTVGDLANAVATGTVTTTGTLTSPAIANATPVPSISGDLDKVDTGTTTITYSPLPKSKPASRLFSQSFLIDGIDELEQITGL